MRYILQICLIVGILFGGCGKQKTDISAPPTDEWIEDVYETDMRTGGTEGDVETGRINESGRPEGPSKRIPIYFRGSLAEVFNDSNYQQYAHAERLGIKPIKDIGSSYFTGRALDKIESGEEYFVAPLTHSLPYLVPEARQLLSDIGRSFRDSLRKRGADGYKIKVTSLLRTPSSVKKLRRVNRNATDSSTHQFGTTFDISWSNFYSENPTHVVHEGDLKNLLAEVLLDKRKEGRCLVKFERKTCCFHITVVK